MRITVTIDDDVRVQLDRRMRETGKSFKDTVNEALRTGLMAQAARKPLKRVKLPVFQLEAFPGVNLDKISALIEKVEGPWHR
ncbi:MAG: hypothetical protein M3O35_12085 [Acidobacteriota bacterium]|nr:hypothetical protein [Acidobacteriota bacterium]